MKTLNHSLIICLLISFISSCENSDDDPNTPNENILINTWHLQMIVEKSKPDTLYLPKSLTASVSFEKDGAVDVQGPCNKGQGNFTNDEATITVKELAMTEIGCDISEFEEMLVNNMSGEYKLTEDVLKILSEFNVELVFFRD